MGNYKFYTIQVDTAAGMPYYHTFQTKAYAERIYRDQCEKLTEGCVTMFENHEWVKEFVKEA